MSDTTTYSVQLAKSSRAKCKSCKEPIQKGELKIFVEDPLKEGADFAMSRSYKVGCFKIPRKLTKEGVGVEEFVADYLLEDSELLEERRDEIIGLLQQAASKAKSKTKKPSDGDGEAATIMDRLKAAANKDDDSEPANKKVKKEETEEEAEFRDMVPVYRNFAKAKLAELKDMLRWNKQIQSGTKPFALFKVIDGVMHGRLSVCPICPGRMKFIEGDFDKIHCGGQYDEDIGRRIPCSYSIPRLANPESVRAQPFYQTEPSEEEKEAMEKILEEAKGGGSNSATANPAGEELLKAAKSIDIDLGSNGGRIKAVEEFLSLVQGKVDLPEHRNAKMEIGKLVMANNGKSAEEIMAVIINKYGFADAKEEKAAAKEAAAESACANPKNAGLVLALGECMKYYFAESNANAALSYKKAIATLITLEEEVTADNAMSFSKGKTKLPGIGKGTAQKMLEFVTTGTFAKLEEKRKAHA